MATYTWISKDHCRTGKNRSRSSSASPGKNVDLARNLRRWRSNWRRCASRSTAISRPCSASRWPAILGAVSLDYVNTVFTDFVACTATAVPRRPGDRGRLGAAGRDQRDGDRTSKRGATPRNRYRNFGMAPPEGYRKVMRADAPRGEVRGRPVSRSWTRPVRIRDSARGAGPGRSDPSSLIEMASLPPIITAVIGEGGSGGALAVVSPIGS